MSDRTQSLLAPAVPSLTQAEDDAVTLAALLEALDRTGLALVVVTHNGRREVAFRDLHRATIAPVVAVSETVPGLLGLLR